MLKLPRLLKRFWRRKTPAEYLAHGYQMLREYDEAGCIKGRPRICRADILDFIGTTEAYMGRK